MQRELKEESLSIRIITEKEVDQLYQLRQDVLRKPLGLDLFTENLSLELDQIKIGAFYKEELVGCVMLKINPADTVKLRQMAVKTNFQNLGIGFRIVQYAEKYCNENKYKIIELHARKEAVPFYLRSDYVLVGDEFLEVGIPHYSMEKKLN